MKDRDPDDPMDHGIVELMCLEHRKVIHELEDLVSSLETGHKSQLLLYNMFLVKRDGEMVNSVALGVFCEVLI